MPTTIGDESSLNGERALFRVFEHVAAVDSFRSNVDLASSATNAVASAVHPWLVFIINAVVLPADCPTRTLNGRSMAQIIAARIASTLAADHDVAAGDDHACRSICDGQGHGSVCWSRTTRPRVGTFHTESRAEWASWSQTVADGAVSGNLKGGVFQSSDEVLLRVLKRSR